MSPSRGPAPSFLFQPLLQGRVEDHESRTFAYARHAGLPKYGRWRLSSNALREGIRKLTERGGARLQVLNPLQQVLELEDDDPDDVKEWAGCMGLQNTLRGLALTAIGRFFDDTASSSSSCLTKFPAKMTWGHPMDPTAMPRMPGYLGNTGRDGVRGRAAVATAACCAAGRPRYGARRGRGRGRRRRLRESARRLHQIRGWVRRSSWL